MAEAGRDKAPILAASDVWFAFSGWLRILEETLGGLEAGRAMAPADTDARDAVVAAIDASPWRNDLSDYLATFDRASGFVATWVDVGEPPRGTGGAYLRLSVRDARLALEQVTAFLFNQLRRIG